MARSDRERGSAWLDFRPHEKPHIHRNLPEMKHTVSHTLGLEMARKVAKAAMDSYAKRFSDYKPVTNWKNEDAADIGFTVKGISLNGSVKVAADAIDLDLDVPFMLRPFKGKALAVIETEIKKWIGKAERGEIA